jgi:predicted PurR-regulated permease PerM
MSSRSPISLGRITTTLIFLALTVFILSVARNFLIPLAFGILFAFVLLPVCNFFERYLKIRLISIFISFLVILLPFLGVISFFGFEFVRLVNGIPSIGKQLKEGLYNILNWTQENLNFGMEEATQWIRTNISTLIDAPLSFLTSSLSSSTSILVGAVLIALYTFFMLWYRTSIRNFFIYQFGENTREEAETLLTGIQKVMQEYLSGIGLVMLILGILNSTGLWLIGIDYPFFWGFLGALLAIIPYIGTTLGGVLPFLYALATTHTFWQPAAIVVMYFGIQQLEGHFITPKVVGSSVQINPMAAIIALIAGGFLWGIAGLILAIPLMAALRILMMHIDYLKPVSELLGEQLYRNSEVFREKYDDDRYRLISFFRKIENKDTGSGKPEAGSENP